MLFLTFLLACTDKTSDDTDAVTTDTTTTTDPCYADEDGDGVAECEGDCDDSNPAISPLLKEDCDGLDNDCDDYVDELFDLDQDGYLADEPDCRLLTTELDCQDLDPLINPGAEELCDGLDNDCTGIADDAEDADGDGYGLCEDCDDTDIDISPGAAEQCDGIDNDCSGSADEPWDEDGDGVSPCGGDCDDLDPDRSPAIEEFCDLQDNDCDGYVDEGFDEDEDGFATCAGDCDDTDPTVNPLGEEICDGLDNDCDGVVNDNEDVDGDGVTLCDGDCDDNSPFVSPDIEEACNGQDSDCSGYVDDSLACHDCADVDGWIYCEASYTWDRAQSVCEGLGYDLVVFDDEEENEMVSAQARDIRFFEWWIGLTDVTTEGTWLWSDGSAMSWSSWAEGEPSEDFEASDCAMTNFGATEGAWGVSTCAGEDHPFICE